MAEKDTRPADVARRALRAAREQRAEHPSREPAEDRPAGGPPRPGDAARAALRRATDAAGADAGSESSRTDAGASTDVAGADAGSDSSRTDTGASPHGLTGASPHGQAGAWTDASAKVPPVADGPREARTATGSRPGDIAREALRAARAEARRASDGPGEPEDGTARRPLRPGGARPSAARRPGRPTDDRARHLRNFLAGAFPMPPEETTEPEETERDDPAADQVTSRAPTADAGPAAPQGTPPAPAAGSGSRSGSGSGYGSGSGSAGAPGHAGIPGRPASSEPTVTPAATASADLAAASRPAAGSGFPVASGPAVTSGPAADSGFPAMPGPSAMTGAEGTPESGSAVTSGSAAGSGFPVASGHPVVEGAEGTPASGSATAPGFPVTSATAATPARAPRSMAAPSRDGEHRRTFPAFPARSAGEGGGFAATWWGNAWVGALEEGALDAKRLLRGRGYAEQGNVDAITVTPGLVLAYVQGSRPRPYRVQVRLRTLGDDDWERFLDAAVERPGHIAALLDKEMPESLAECGVPLLPGPGDLEPHCSCPDRGHPCKHAAALCYQTARLLDADPFVLLLLRGRGERELLDALSRRNATRAARAAQEQGPEPLPGVRATEVLDPARLLPPLPAPLPAPPHPGQPPAYPAVPDGPDSFALDQLATDAAARAHVLLTTGHDGIGELTLWQDAVRIAASRPGSGLTAGTRALYASLASAAGRTPAELARAVAAWRQGGPEGLAVLEEPWDPPAGRFDRARPLLLAADLPAFRPWRNQLTHPRGHVQLRLGRDGLWYAYESEPGHDDWWPRGTPDPDPVGALTGLVGPGDDL